MKSFILAERVQEDGLHLGGEGDVIQQQKENHGIAN
jgi:hypothetical protein